MGSWSFIEWRQCIIERDGPEICDVSILKSDMCRPKELVEKDFCTAVCKFIMEVQTQQGTGYQPSTLCDIVTSIQSHLHANKVY